MSLNYHLAHKGNICAIMCFFFQGQLRIFLSKGGLNHTQKNYITIAFLSTVYCHYWYRRAWDITSKQRTNNR